MLNVREGALQPRAPEGGGQTAQLRQVHVATLRLHLVPQHVEEVWCGHAEPSVRRRDADQRLGGELIRARCRLFGEGIEEILPRMRFGLGGKDLFNLILSRDVDVLIRDASAAKVRLHLPDWYRQGFDAASFLVLPMRYQNQPLAMIYAESGQVDGIRPGTETLNLLRTLRNQALLALRR